MRILITNSVPLNGGDHSLLISTVLFIRSKYPDAIINVLCNNYEICSKYITDIELNYDWEYTVFMNAESKRAKIRKLLFDIGINYYTRVSMLLSNSKEKEIVKLYKNADIILSSAGGYIHDIYGYENRLKAFEMAIKFNKKLYFIGHSMGPFYTKYEKVHKRLLKILEKSEDIVLREENSDHHLNLLKRNWDNKRVTIDLAFSLYSHYPNLFIIKKSKNKNIVLSFRKWGNESTTKEIIKKAVFLTNHLIEIGFELTFLSTCQGIPEYVDDSLIAEKIINNLSEYKKGKCRIDYNKYNPIELIQEYSKFDMYIGMRLHGAILSMLGGTLAFNIAYEDKTDGIFSKLDISSNQIWYENDVDQWISIIDNFIDRFNSSSYELQSKIEFASKLALNSFNKI